MKRALIVVLIGMLIASVSGFNDRSLALDGEGPQASDAHLKEIAARAGNIGVGRVVRIERTDGRRFNALLEEIMADAMTVVILEGPDRQRETIPFAEIVKIDEVRGHMLRNVLIGVGIGAAILVGTCAAALSSSTRSSSTPPQANR